MGGVVVPEFLRRRGADSSREWWGCNLEREAEIFDWVQKISIQFIRRER
jgi:hypothetical protein